MSDLAGFVAVFACTLFTGAAVYITLVEHPARLACGTEIAATEFVPSYKRAAVIQGSLAAVATVAGIARSVLAADLQWLWPSLLIFAVIPFTIVVIFPTNQRLLQPGRDRTSAETRRLLDQWGWLHAVRSVLGLAASATFIWLVVRF